MSSMPEVSFQDLLGGDSEWLFGTEVGVSWMRCELAELSNNGICLSSDGKLKGFIQHWALGVCDDTTGEGIFTGGLSRHSPFFVDKRFYFCQSVAELLALITACEWGICKQKFLNNAASHLTIVCDHTSWVTNYKDLRAGGVVNFAGVGYEECFFKLMVYITRACSFFDKVVILHKKNSHHRDVSADEFAPDVLSMSGLTCDIKVEAMRKPHARAWRTLARLCPMPDLVLDDDSLVLQAVFKTETNFPPLSPRPIEAI